MITSNTFFRDEFPFLTTADTRNEFFIWATRIVPMPDVVFIFFSAFNSMEIQMAYNTE